MFRIDTDGSIQGKFTDGNPQTGQEGTVASAEWLNETQETIAKAIELAGIALVKGDATQLYDAMLAIARGVAGAGVGEGTVPTSRNVGTAGLASGGGDLTANRTITVPAATVADVVAGTRGDAAVTPATLAGAMSGGVGASGYVTMPGGVIFQWGGKSAFSNEGQVTDNFAIPFPNSCDRLVITAVNSTASETRDVGVQIVSKSKTGFIGFYQWSGAAGGTATIDGLDWFAIGH